MNIEEFRDYCINKKGVEEHLPFDETTLAFHMGRKNFAFVDIDSFEFVNLKCDPEKAIILREKYVGIKPGYHMNKKHWNSVYTNSDVSDALMLELIDHSYDLIIQSLPKKIKEKLLTH